MATQIRLSDITRSEAGDLPRSLGRYELLCELASGGMGTVYLGRACGVAGFGRYVAIKCSHPHLRRQEEFAAMLIDEARLAAQLHHPNVVPTLDVGEDDADGSLYLVMDFVDGFSLWQLLHAARACGRALPPAVALRIMVDVLTGLHAAHELRDEDGTPLDIVHRDVSPHNVLVGVDGVARITDFGIAKAVSRLSVTQEGMIKGKLCYMAPEQHGLDCGVAPAEVTRQADVYAAGVVLWEALTGTRLFQGETERETVMRVVNVVPPPPSEYAPDVPPALDAVVARALERDPARRFATAIEMAEALEDCGVRLAPARVVGALVRELLPDAIAARQRVLRRYKRPASGRYPIAHAAERRPPAPDRDADARTVENAERAAVVRATEATAAAAAPDELPPTRSHARAPSRWLRRLVVGVAAACALGAAAFGLTRLHLARVRAGEARVAVGTRHVTAGALGPAAPGKAPDGAATWENTEESAGRAERGGPGEGGRARRRRHHRTPGASPRAPGGNEPSGHEPEVFHPLAL